jgi:hypothetical protein
MINGVLYRARTGVPWRDLPGRYGCWVTVYKRHRRWSADGTWQRLLAAMQAAEDAAGRIDGDVTVDSTTVRAYQHTAGAPCQAPPPPAGDRGEPVGINRGDPTLTSLRNRLATMIKSANA